VPTGSLDLLILTGEHGAKNIEKSSLQLDSERVVADPEATIE
jgi:hypothetical protein